MEAPAERFVDLVVHALDTATATAREQKMEIGAVAMTTFWHSLLGLSADGEPLTPLYGWGDSRAAQTAIALSEEISETAMHGRTGCFLHPSYPLVKLAWLRRSEPEIYRKVARWVSIGEYLDLRFFGRMRCSFSMASGTGLLNVTSLSWDPEMLALVGLAPDHLAPLVDTDDLFTGLKPEFAERWPELSKVPWFPALGDGACANVGSGAIGREYQGVTVGTSAAVRTLWETDNLTVPKGLWCYRLDGRRVVAGGALSNGGNAVAYLENVLKLPAGPDWDSGLIAIEPDSHGLTILPFLVAERGPRWLQQESAAVIGMCQTTPPLHLLRAWMEAIAYQIGIISTALQNTFSAPDQIRASGGALHASPLWTQMIADVLGRPVGLSRTVEATAYGAALVAQERLGLIPSLEQANRLDTPAIEPNSKHHARYQLAVERQNRLFEALTH